MKIFAPHATDFYKTGHIRQYPEGTQYVYSNFTCRADKWAAVLPDFDHKVVMFGLQGVLQWLLVDLWNDTFFLRPKDEVVEKYKRRMDTSLGTGSVSVEHIAALHDLGYLPVKIKAIPEGSRVNIRVPLFTVINTHPDFYWVTNYLETQLSAELWKLITSATTAYEYRRLFEQYADTTGGDKAFIDFQGHDFSMRGMSGIADATANGAAHLLSFKGTDTISAIDFLEQYYAAHWEFVGGSVPATEHSVMCMGGEGDELETFRRLIEDVYPAGIVSIVSDTWDFWQVITEFTVKLKDKILARNGKVVFRPDSGDPVKIIIGSVDVKDHSERSSLEEAKAWMKEELEDEVREATAHGEAGEWQVTGYFRFDGKVYKLVADIDWNRYDKQYYYIDGSTIKSCEEVQLTPDQKGAVECLWDIFGGTVTEKGFKKLDSHVGLIYGDSISLARAFQILDGLAKKGFSSDNIVFGIGSFTYQYVTRDTFGSAVKATWGVVKGVARDLCKDPKTDDGVKKSAKGLIRIEKKGGDFVLFDQQNTYEEDGGELRLVFNDGKLHNAEPLHVIRQRLLN